VLSHCLTLPPPKERVLFKCYKKTIPHSIKERGIQGKDYFNTIKGLKGFSGFDWDFDFLSYI